MVWRGVKLVFKMKRRGKEGIRKKVVYIFLECCGDAFSPTSSRVAGIWR